MISAGASVSYVAGTAPVTLDAGLAVADAAAVSLSAATVSISAGFVQGDTLSVASPQTGIASQYNATTGVLTLSGAASLAAYEAELDSITYASANATTSSRTMLWSVNDGVNASAPVTSHMSVSSNPSAPAPDLNIPLQNTSSQVSVWEINGNSILGGGPVANPGPSWQAIGTGEFNNDGNSDILMQKRAAARSRCGKEWQQHHHRRRTGGQSRAELESDRDGRLQSRWEFRHPDAEHRAGKSRSGK